MDAPPIRTHQSCRHCQFTVPAESPLCPGCGRPAIDHWRSIARGQKRVTRRAARVAPPLASAGYRSLLPHATFARALLSLTTLIALPTAAIFAGWALRIDTPWVAVGDERIELEPVARTATVVLLGALAITGVAFVAWAVRAYRNLPSLGIGERRYWTIWLVIGWVVPGANLFVPKLLVDDIWRGSSPSAQIDGADEWQRRPVASIVNRWWYSFLLTPAIVVLGVIVVRGGLDDFDRQVLAGVAATAAAVSVAAATSAARRLVAVVTVAQARRADLVADVRAGAESASTYRDALADLLG